jgi:uncharacterized membrane protein
MSEPDDRASLASLRWRMLTIGGGLLLMLIGLSAWGWLSTPNNALIPVHWNVHGEADGYGDKLQAFGVVPLMFAVLMAIFIALPSLEPRRRHLQQSRKPYMASFLATAMLLCVVHIGLCATAVGLPIDMPRVISAAMGVLFIVIGNYLGKIRSNFFIGIRTPWTLSSELSWRKTHRLGGSLFLAVGLLMMLAALAPDPARAMLAVTGLLLLGVLGLVVYSYLQWRGDRGRTQDADTPA